jgi:hypothetical protein
MPSPIPLLEATLAEYEARAKTTDIGPVHVTVLDDGASHLVYIDGDGIAVTVHRDRPDDWDVDIAAVGVTVTRHSVKVEDEVIYVIEDDED